MLVDDVRIQDPCHENWSAMEGQGAQRFCESCERHVHDLSAMSESEADDLVQSATRAGERLCVRYSIQSDGKIRHRTPTPPPPTLVSIRPRSIPTPAQRPAALARAGLAAALLAACTPHSDDAKPCPESIFAPAEPEMLGKIAADPPLVEPPQVDEAPPRMGEIPPPNYAPPPPVVEPTIAVEPTGEPALQGQIVETRMGDIAPPPVRAMPPQEESIEVMGKMVEQR